MMIQGFKTKNPASKYDIGFRVLGLKSGETIVLVGTTVSVFPPGLLLHQNTKPDIGAFEFTGIVIDGNEVTEIVSGGADGEDYTVHFHVKTSLAREDDFDYLVKVRS